MVDTNSDVYIAKLSKMWDTSNRASDFSTHDLESIQTNVKSLLLHETLDSKHHQLLFNVNTHVTTILCWKEHSPYKWKTY
jgi:hypothetical protein